MDKAAGREKKKRRQGKRGRREGGEREGKKKRAKDDETETEKVAVSGRRTFTPTNYDSRRCYIPTRCSILIPRGRERSLRGVVSRRTSANSKTEEKSMGPGTRAGGGRSKWRRRGVRRVRGDESACSDAGRDRNGETQWRRLGAKSARGSFARGKRGADIASRSPLVLSARVAEPRRRRIPTVCRREVITNAGRGRSLER